METWTKFLKLCNDSGLTSRICTDEHWQCYREGGPIVNYYPFAKGGPTIYVNGTRRGVKGNANMGQAVAAALGSETYPWQPNDDSRKGQGWRRRTKRRLIQRDGFRCRWCGVILQRGEETIDHVIPRDKGGADTIDNLCLSCGPCNAARGNRLPAPGEFRDGKPTPTVCPISGPQSSMSPASVDDLVERYCVDDPTIDRGALRVALEAMEAAVERTSESDPFDTFTPELD